MTLALALVVLAAAPVQLEPATLTFGAQPGAAIVLVAPGAKSVTAVSANAVGGLSAAERIADGRFRARFTFPAERFPQVALIRLEIEAEDGTKSRQWVALPLIANAHLKIETKPRATVSVTIGEKSFGPAIADGRGKVTIPAQVPPGFASASVLAVDRAGNRTTQPLDLQPRPFARAAGALASGEASADQPVPLEIFAVEPDGRPLSKAEGLRLSAKLGSLDAPSARSEGVFLAAYRAPKSAAVGLDVISIGVEGATASTQLEVKLRAGAPARLVVTLTPPAFTAGSGVASKLKVDAVDANGNAAAMGVPPVFTADFGQLDTTADGLLLRVPDDFAGRSQAQVRATANGITGEGALTLVAARPVRAELTFPSHVVAGQTDLGQLRVSDAFGNPVEHAAVEVVLLPQRRSGAITEAGKGQYDVALATDPDDPPGERTIALTANGVSVGSSSVIVRPSQRRWAFTVGAMGFVQSNLAQWVTGGPRLSLGLRLGGTGLDVIAEGAFGAYAPIQGARSVSGDGGFDIRMQELSAALGARYWIAFGVRGSVQLSIVGGFQRTSSTVSLREPPQTTLSDVNLGPLVRGAAGVGFYLGFGRALLQLEYTLAPGGGLVRGNLGGAGLSLGYVVSF